MKINSRAVSLSSTYTRTGSVRIYSLGGTVTETLKTSDGNAGTGAYLETRFLLYYLSPTQNLSFLSRLETPTLVMVRYVLLLSTRSRWETGQIQ